jgi:hypothetical protein
VLNTVVVREFNLQYTHSGEYPHIFNNGEGLSFPCKKDLLEFPILTTGVYRPGRDQPGADRVVYKVVKKKKKDTLQYALHPPCCSVTRFMNYCSIDIVDA